ELHPVLSCPLGPVEGPVRGREELPLAGSGPVLGHAEAAGDPYPRPVTALEGALRQGLADAVGELGPAGHIGPRQEEDELLAAPATRQVGVADGRAKHAREL